MSMSGNDLFLLRLIQENARKNLKSCPAEAGKAKCVCVCA